jgi:hypothetical protein
LVSSEWKINVKEDTIFDLKAKLHLCQWEWREHGRTISKKKRLPFQDTLFP